MWNSSYVIRIYCHIHKNEDLDEIAVIQHFYFFFPGMSFPNFLRIAIVTNMNIFKINKSRTDYVQAIGGLEYPFLKILSEALRFNYSLKIPDDGQWGTAKKDGTGDWSGMIGLVQRNETDIAVSKIGIANERMAVVDFSYPYGIESLRFGTKPPDLRSKEVAVFLPFDATLWIGILMALFCVIFTFKLVTFGTPIARAFLFFYGNLLMKSQTLNYRKLQVKILVGSWFLSSMILSYSYMAVLLSFLTIHLKEQTVSDNFELLEALNTKEYKCVTLAGSSLLMTLLSSKDETVLAIAKQIDVNEWLIKPTEIEVATTLNQPNIAVVVPEYDFGILFEEQVFVSKDSFCPIFWGIALSKNFCCKRKLDSLIHRLTAAGLYNKLRSDFLFHSQMKYSKLMSRKTVGFKQLNQQDVQGAFIALIFGCILSCISFAAEVIYDKVKKYLIFMR